MKKVNVPDYDPLDVYDMCVGAIDDTSLGGPYTANRSFIQSENTKFDTASLSATWSSLKRVKRGEPDVLVAGKLTKKQMMDLYTRYMVATKGLSRDVYDDLLTASGSLCPFCGDLGQVNTLDHYLPKANFPAYSVYPHNLVPCCRDCNSGKNASFGASTAEQTLHPYLDHPHFFDERWIVASVYREDPILLKFKCEPPTHWSTIDQRRVRNHFDGYNLSQRFSVQAGAEISRLVQLRANSLKALSVEAFQDYLLENANSSDFILNGWNRTMYTALATLDWFVQADFNDPNWHVALDVEIDAS